MLTAGKHCPGTPSEVKACFNCNRLASIASNFNQSIHFPTYISDDTKLLAWKKIRGCGRDTGVEHNSHFLHSFQNTASQHPAAATLTLVSSICSSMAA